MRNSSAKRGQVSASAPTTVGERVVTFLKRIHPTKTAVHVAAETGVSSDAVEKWLERASVPNGLAMIRLTAAYGPEFLCAVMNNPPAWLDAAVRSERQAALEAQLLSIQNEIASLKGTP